MSYRVFRNFIDEEYASCLLDEINKLPWLKDLSRDTQHYGYKYDYKTRKVTKLGELPNFLKDLKKKLHFNDCDQVIVNKYLPGQGIALHKDAAVFDNRIATVSLGSACMFKIGGEEIYLKPGDVVVMTKPIVHGIDQRIFDVIDGQRIPRGTRISITLRKVI